MFNPLDSLNAKEKRIAQSNHFLELYKQGNSYQKIGDIYGLSRERVRQILNRIPSFRKYQQEEKEAKAKAKAEEKRIKAEQKQKNISSRSLATLYPERVAELWDYEKNKELNPDNFTANNSTLFIWLKCPIDGHSWKKKPADISTSWSRSGTSGCPVCAGKRKKAEKIYHAKARRREEKKNCVESKRKTSFKHSTTASLSFLRPTLSLLFSASPRDTLPHSTCCL